ncbi:unnamed protein product, partial [Iphiclides podalirius]
MSCVGSNPCIASAHRHRANGVTVALRSSRGSPHVRHKAMPPPDTLASAHVPFVLLSGDRVRWRQKTRQRELFPPESPVRESSRGCIQPPSCG